MSNSRVDRRELLKSFCGVSALVAISTSNAFGAGDDSMPKVGDLLAYAKGDKKGQTITPADLVADAQPILARPKDPVSGALKDQTLKSLILLYRTAAANLPAELAVQSANGIVGYSAICTHLGCAVEEWDADKQFMTCPCHKGTYDPRQSAKVVSGPPPRSLPLLPLKLVDQNIVVAGAFSARVGAQQQ